MRFVSLTLLVASYFMFSCVSSKTEAEFNAKKPTIALIIEPSTFVEKKTALNVLIPEYVTHTPKDSLMLAIFNQYLLYYLDDIGYKILFTRDQSFKQEYLQGVEMVYSVKLGNLPFKEFIHKEYVPTNGTNTQTIRMHGIEVNPWAEVITGSDSPQGSKEAMRAFAHSQKEESQQGQFKQTGGVRNVVNGNATAPSVKYIYNITRLEDGVFQNLCLDGAQQLAKQIDFTLKRTYQKAQKKKKA